MNISPVSHSVAPSVVSSNSSLTPAATASTEDHFERIVYHASSDTPLTDAYTGKINDPSTSVSERVVLGALIPIMVPIMAILDTVLYPVIKMGQFSDWVASKFS